MQMLHLSRTRPRRLRRHANAVLLHAKRAASTGNHPVSETAPSGTDAVMKPAEAPYPREHDCRSATWVSGAPRNSPQASSSPARRVVDGELADGVRAIRTRQGQPVEPRVPPRGCEGRSRMSFGAFAPSALSMSESWRPCSRVYSRSHLLATTDDRRPGTRYCCNAREGVRQVRTQVSDGRCPVIGRRRESL